MNVGNRGSAVVILVALDLIFFAAAILLTLHGSPEAVDDKVWEAFAGMNGALLLILKSDNSHDAPLHVVPQNPTQPLAGQTKETNQ